MYWEFLINKPVPRTQWVSTTQAGVQVETSHNQRALVWLQVKTNLIVGSCQMITGKN